MQTGLSGAHKDGGILFYEKRILVQFYVMRLSGRNLVILFAAAVSCFSCATRKQGTGKTITGLTFVGEFDFPHRMQFQGTTVGGLSGIDYVPAEDVYHLVC